MNDLVIWREGAPLDLMRSTLQIFTYFIVSRSAYGDLVDAVGSQVDALESLASLAEEAGKPIGVRLEGKDDAGPWSGPGTMFISPAGWTAERLRGYTAGVLPSLEENFTPAGWLCLATPEDAE